MIKTLGNNRAFASYTAAVVKKMVADYTLRNSNWQQLGSNKLIHQLLLCGILFNAELLPVQRASYR
jgi:hypothetical protein